MLCPQEKQGHEARCPSFLSECKRPQNKLRSNSETFSLPHPPLKATKNYLLLNFLFCCRSISAHIPFNVFSSVMCRCSLRAEKTYSFAVKWAPELLSALTESWCHIKDDVKQVTNILFMTSGFCAWDIRCDNPLSLWSSWRELTKTSQGDSHRPQ